MKSKSKKILLGVTTLGTIIAPVATLVACDSSTTTTLDVVSNDTDKVWDGLTVGEFKEQINKSSDAATASSNFMSQIKYELTEKLYQKEYDNSFEYQKGFLRWNIFSAQKSQLVRAKEIAAAYDGVGTTSSQISVDPAVQTPDKFIGTVLGITFTNNTYNSKELFAHINGLSKDDANAKDKTTFNSKLETFKNEFTRIEKLQEKLDQIDNLKSDSDSGWDSVATDYPLLLKSVGKITETETKTYNEAKAAFIDQYRTKGGGAEEWTRERSSKYNGASTDAEAIKYLVNQQIQSAAFGQFTYSLNDSFTVEQALATYNDNGTIKHIFPWFEGYNGASTSSEATIGDSKWTSNSGKEYKIWTKTISEFESTAAVNLHIDTDNVTDLFVDTKESKNVIAPLLNNKVFFLNRNTKVINNIVVDLKGQTELSNAPIMITHSLIKATQDKTSPNLPWTIDKDALKNLFKYFGDSDVTKAKQGIELFSTLYSDNNQTWTDVYNQYVSDDTGSRANNGELGTQTYQWYARQGGMNDGFALATMIAYSNIKNHDVANTYDLGNSIKKVTPNVTDNDGEELIANLKSELLSKIPTNIFDVKNPKGTTGAANTTIAAWIDGLSDNDVKSMFGAIFAKIFNERSAVYELNEANNKFSRYLLASPDSGVHIINITSDANDWAAKYQIDMQNVAKENAIGKAKVDWAKLYSDYFTEDEIIANLLKDKTYNDQITNLPTTNPTLVAEWVKAGYVTFASNDTNAQKGKKITDAIEQSIEATRINNKSANSRNALSGRIGTYLIGQMDSKYIDPTIDPTTLYTELLKSLLAK